jgi:hypothetical protein
MLKKCTSRGWEMIEKGTVVSSYREVRWNCGDELSLK